MWKGWTCGPGRRERGERGSRSCVAEPDVGGHVGRKGGREEGDPESVVSGARADGEVGGVGGGRKEESGRGRRKERGGRGRIKSGGG